MKAEIQEGDLESSESRVQSEGESIELVIAEEVEGLQKSESRCEV